MKPSPVINVANSAPASAAKPASGASSDQSFGQVLAQQVNNPPASSSSTGNAQNSTAPGNSNAALATGSSNSAGDSTSAGSNTTAAGGKGLKPKHGQDDSNAATTADASQNGSAQLLALVSNVQLATTGTGTPTTNIGDASAAVAANSATTAQAALSNFQSAVATTATAARNTAQATPDFSKELKAVLPQDDTQATQDVEADSDPETTATAAIASNTQTASPLSVDQQTATPAQPAAQLAAAAQTDVQADIASLAQAAAKSADTIRDTVAAATAAPAMVNTTQLNTAASQMSGTEDKLTPQVGSPGWDQALGQKVVWMVAGGQQSASLTLNPPDLGPMQVVLSVNNSHATATFTAAQPEVRQALETAMPKLREMLGDAGIQLGQASVNAGTAQQQQNFANQASSRSNGGSTGVDSIGDTLATVAQAAAKVSSGIGLVDTFA